MPKSAQNFPYFFELSEEEGVDLEVCQCLGCGLVQLNNERVPYYKEVIRAAAFSEEMRQFRVDQFSRFVSEHCLAGKRVIEIGCGKGEFLSLMNDAGVDAYGIEYAQSSVQVCKDAGLNVSKFYIETISDSLEGAPFDCFFILNFFEHLPDPNTTLRALHSNLAEDGVGLIEVPNFDMIIRDNLFSEFISDHLFYFTKETLTSLLEKNGFEVVKCEEIWHDYIISAVVKKRKKLDLGRFHNQQEKITKEIHNYINRYGSNNVCIYGAGHQALAVMSLAKIGDSIKYVVDDAPFKQGRCTPATHIPILSPEALKSDLPQAIIIMAASYSDEVAKKLKKKHSNVDLTILRDFGLEKI